jgi:hypothetical protein
VNDLDRDTDELNRLLLAAEEKLESMKLSVQACVVLHVEPVDGQPVTETWLTFSRHGKEWGIHISGTPITSCTRAQKVAAVHQLGAMQNKLIEEHERWRAKVHDAIGVAKKFVENGNAKETK